MWEQKVNRSGKDSMTGSSTCEHPDVGDKMKQGAPVLGEQAQTGMKVRA